MAEILLMIIAFVVYALQVKKMNAWGWIVLYWAVLTVRNAMELGGVL